MTRARNKNSKTAWFSKWRFYLPLVAGALFILILILHYGVNTPSEDQWEMVPLFEKISHHSLGISDLWAQHNEHRIFFPLLVLLANAYLTHWNTIVECLVGLVVATFSGWLIFMMLDERIKKGWTGIIATSLIALWYFSPVERENWMWGWQLEWFMCAAGGIAAIFLLLKLLKSNDRKMRRLLFALAAISAFIGTFSLASGIFAWVAGLFVLVVGRQNRRKIVTWTVLGLLSAILYYHHYAQIPTPMGSALHVLHHHPFGFIEFFLAFLGGVIGPLKLSLQAPDIVGSLLILCLAPMLYLVWQRRKNVVLYLPWLAIIVFSLLCDLSTAYGRLGYGVSFALNSRYTAFSLLYMIGLVGLAFTLMVYTDHISENTKRLFNTSIVAFSLPLLISSYVVGIHSFRTQSNYLNVISTCTHQQNPTDACLSQTYPSPQLVLPRLNYLKAKHWAGY